MELDEGVKPNLVFLSPNFPDHFYLFCAALKKHGIRVLGLGDEAFENLTDELKNSLNSYFQISSLDNYESVYSGFAFFVTNLERLLGFIHIMKLGSLWKLDYAKISILKQDGD